MGKNQSKYTKRERKGCEAREKGKRRSFLKAIRWLANRFDAITNKIGIEKRQQKNAVTPALDNSSREEFKRNELYDASCSIVSNDASVRERLRMVGLDDDSINVLKNNDLSTSFFLETDQDPGCSQWIEEVLEPKDNGIRRMNPRIKNKQFGMRSSCSKTSPNAAYNTPGEVCEQADVNADIEDIDATIEDAMQSPFASSRVFIDLQSTGVPSERESISSSEICCFNSFSNSTTQHDDIVEGRLQDDQADKTIDGLFSHLCYFSPKHIMEGSLSLAEAHDDLQPPMIEIITEEKAKHIVASILINYTLAKEHAIRGLTEMYSTRMCEALMMQLNWWNSTLPISWSEFFVKVSKTSFHRFVTGQVVLERKVMGNAQCSFSCAKKEGWC